MAPAYYFLLHPLLPAPPNQPVYFLDFKITSPINNITLHGHTITNNLYTNRGRWEWEQLPVSRRLLRRWRGAYSQSAYVTPWRRTSPPRTFGHGRTGAPARRLFLSPSRSSAWGAGPPTAALWGAHAVRRRAVDNESGTRNGAARDTEEDEAKLGLGWIRLGQIRGPEWWAEPGAISLH
jgi:hypothetical protein